MLIGRVAKLLSGASVVPTMPAVATNTGAVAARERLRHRQHQRVTPGEAIVRGHVHDGLGKGRHPRFFQRGIRVERIFVSGRSEDKPVRGTQIRSAAHPDGGSPPSALALGATHRSGRMPISSRRSQATGMVRREASRHLKS